MMHYWRAFQFFKIVTAPMRMALQGVDDVFRILATYKVVP